jgi:hypothetical protein
VIFNRTTEFKKIVICKTDKLNICGRAHTADKSLLKPISNIRVMITRWTISCAVNQNLRSLYSGILPGLFRSSVKVTIHPTKSMIAFASKKRIAYVIQLGKNFVDIVLPFDKPYEDNLCFRKIAQVPGTQQFNHHLRLMSKDDINKEVLHFMKLAYEKAMSSEQ